MKKENPNYILIIVCFFIFFVFASHLVAHFRFTQNTTYAKNVLKIEDNIQKKLVDWSYRLYIQKEKIDKEKHDQNVVDKNKQIKAGTLDSIDDVKIYNKYNKDTDINDMDTISFGKYYLSNGNLMEPVEWIVLKRSFGKALLLSKYNIECMQFGNKKWSESMIRSWLNNKFINVAFSNEEINKIINTNLSDENCKDKVFILSEGECKKYMLSKDWSLEATFEERAIKVISSNYVKSKTNSQNNDSCWTRTFKNVKNVVFQIPNGYLSDIDNNKLVGVRPAIWIKYR